MRKIKKPILRILSAFLFVVMLIFQLPPMQAEAAPRGLTMDQLMAKFPDGKYWNGGNPDGWTNTPCAHHGNCPYNGTCGCNSFMGMSIQCMGFAEKLGYDATGYNPRLNADGWYTYTSVSALNNIKPGDIVRRNGHSIYVIGVDGDTVTFADCNSKNRSCNIRWGGVTTKSNLRNNFEHVRSAPFPLVSGYLGSCDAYISYGQVTTAAEITLKTYPCRTDTYEGSLDGATVDAGATLEITGLYRNSVGEYWYETQMEDGYGYLPAGEAGVFTPYESTVLMEDVSFPVNTWYGSGFPIKGVVSSDGLPLSQVGAYIFEGTAVSDTPYMVSEDTELDCMSYSIYGSRVDNNLTFGRLPKGEYTYLLTAAVTNYYIADGNLVSDSRITRLHQNTFTVSGSIACTHSFAAGETMDATCGDDGHTVYACQKCGFTYQQTAFSSGKHNLGDWHIAKAPTCTEVGYEIQNCEGCTLNYLNTLPAIGHNVVTTERVDATCTTPGITDGSYCDGCGAVFTAQEILPATGHQEAEKTVLPTCTEEGYSVYYCADCGEELYMEDYVAALGHSYESVVTPPAIGVQGYTTHTCTICGDSYADSYTDPLKPALPEGDGALQIRGATLTLQSNLKVSFLVHPQTLEAFQNVYMEFTFAGKTVTVSDYTMGNDGMLRYTLPGVAPRMMNDTIGIVMYGTWQGQTYTYENTYQASNYCYNQLQKTTKSDLRTLIVDLLNYATEHQKYIGYNTENLVNSKLTAAQKAYGSNHEMIYTSVFGQTGTQTEAKFTGATLILTDAVVIRYDIQCEDLTGVSLQVTVSDRTYNIPAEQFIPAGENLYHIRFSGLSARQMRETVTATVCRNGEAISKTATYSVESYVSAVKPGSKVAALVKAMMYYGDSAKAYLE